MNDEIIPYEAFIQLVLEALEATGIAYMIGGAVASWAWGEPRATLDLDVVVDISLEAVGQLSEELEKRDMLVPPEIILENLLENRADLPISAIHIHSGYKADLYPLREGDALRAAAFGRRQLVDLGRPIGEVYLHSPEDLIIYKLWFYSLSQQTKHIRDITSIMLNMGEELELNYIETWVKEKGLTTLWSSLLARIRTQDPGTNKLSS